MPAEIPARAYEQLEQLQVRAEEIEKLKEVREKVAASLVSLNDTAEILGVTRRTVYRRIADGDLVSVSLWDRTFIRRDSLVAYLVRLSDEVNAALAATQPPVAAA